MTWRTKTLILLTAVAGAAAVGVLLAWLYAGWDPYGPATREGLHPELFDDPIRGTLRVGFFLVDYKQLGPDICIAGPQSLQVYSGTCLEAAEHYIRILLHHDARETR